MDFFLSFFLCLTNICFFVNILTFLLVLIKVSGKTFFGDNKNGISITQVLRIWFFFFFDESLSSLEDKNELINQLIIKIKVKRMQILYDTKFGCFLNSAANGFKPGFDKPGTRANY